MIQWARISTSAAFIAALIIAVPVTAQETGADKKTVDTKRDVRKTGPTADNQKNDKADLELTKKIRQAIVDDKSLSTYAHNVKVISQNGTVTLRGYVRSEEEKRVVESKAQEVAGAGSVKSDIKIRKGKSDSADSDSNKSAKKPS